MKPLAELLDDEYIPGLSTEERNSQMIYWFEKAIDVYEIFPIENDIKLESYKIAVNSLKAQEEIKKDLRWYLDTNEENGVVYIPKLIIEKTLNKL